MMKKVLSILLAVLTVIGCFAIGASAVDAEPEEPVKTESGYYVGQRIKPGETITSVNETCEMLAVTYSIGRADAEEVTSALQKQYANPAFVGVVSFRDNIASFSSGDLYKGVYTVKSVGDTVDEMETENGTFKTATDIYNGLDKEVQKKLKSDIVLKIDYEHSKTTYYQYTTITEWEVNYVNETANGLTIRLQAVYETREPNGFESFVEKLYVNWLKFLDKLGDFLIPIVPKIIHFWARLLGNK